ncbi:MAG TPA: hypothetical protein PKL54_14270, partial [Candidatus Hydrogenedentes bacterium]|nr:hypothetical protein [Candidatus Hydrogenedentota bacterium]
TGYEGGGSDVTLLRLRSAPPAGLARAGWTTAVPAPGAQVTCLHHPSGSWKRISHGALSDIDNAFPEWYHEVIRLPAGALRDRPDHRAALGGHRLVRPAAGPRLLRPV